MAVNSLAAIARKGKNESARVQAATVLFNRGWGVAQGEEQDSKDGIRITIRQIMEGKPKGEK